MVTFKSLLKYAHMRGRKGNKKGNKRKEGKERKRRN
jgi:hypothetical protein